MNTNTAIDLEKLFSVGRAIDRTVEAPAADRRIIILPLARPAKATLGEGQCCDKAVRVSDRS